ncbi:uncharacterized protein LOC62_04G005381 [Vanrija pseudolonga]|uniref:Uncharacterized protein n=1 Tax=Vanrija pseudolonga TaxID=143232 RepID=A0AAF0Y881_9TREE|nr:hypothetical protein LOC62_04G005381 [Vanrija pseudolonga]
MVTVTPVASPARSAVDHPRAAFSPSASPLKRARLRLPLPPSPFKPTAPLFMNLRPSASARGLRETAEAKPGVDVSVVITAPLDGLQWSYDIDDPDPLTRIKLAASKAGFGVERNRSGRRSVLEISKLSSVDDIATVIPTLVDILNTLPPLCDLEVTLCDARPRKKGMVYPSPKPIPETSYVANFLSKLAVPALTMLTLVSNDESSAAAALAAFLATSSGAKLRRLRIDAKWFDAEDVGRIVDAVEAHDVPITRLCVRGCWFRDSSCVCERDVRQPLNYRALISLLTTGQLGRIPMLILRNSLRFNPRIPAVMRLLVMARVLLRAIRPPRILWPSRSFNALRDLFHNNVPKEEPHRGIVRSPSHFDFAAMQRQPLASPASPDRKQLRHKPSTRLVAKSPILKLPAELRLKIAYLALDDADQDALSWHQAQRVGKHAEDVGSLRRLASAFKEAERERMAEMLVLDEWLGGWLL